MTDKNQIQFDQLTDRTEVDGRNLEFDYLRSFAVVLVLFHHAIIAYTTFASINFENPIASSSPIVNNQRWPIFDLFVVYNETYFMPLLFFISGLFIWKSLARKDSRKFFAGRLKRLGIPFIFGVVFLVPLFYYPALLQIGQIQGISSNYWTFWLELIKSCFGTAGPLWFIWLLLVFDCLIIVIYRIIHSHKTFIIRRSDILSKKPFVLFGVLIGISIVVYLPLTLILGPLTWIGSGPFHVQIGRILLYLLYFLTGTFIGANGFDNNLFRSNGFLVKHWWKLMILGFITCITFIIMIVAVTKMERTIITEIAFVISCGSTVFGLTGFFLRFMKKRIRILDNLSKNSYGIYIFHYVFITWLQYLLLGIDLSPFVKGLLVFVGTLILSWFTIAIIRRNPVIAKIL